MSDEVELSMSVPLDEDGFLRRECPTCEREFKLFVPDEDEDEDEFEDEFEDEEETESGSADDYFCPYCGVQAPPDAWHTKAQIALAENRVMREVVGPELREFERQLRDVGRSSGGLVQARMDAELPPEADPLTETDDMRRVEFACHPTEPVKIVEDWTSPVFCLVCGTRSSA